MADRRHGPRARAGGPGNKSAPQVTSRHHSAVNAGLPPEPVVTVASPPPCGHEHTCSPHSYYSGGNVPQRSVVAVGASLLVASLALAGCGTRGDSGSDASGSGSSGNKTAKIGVIAPLSGDLAALGLGIKNSVDLAIKQANENKTIPGWTLELAAEDDEAKPDVGKNAATKLASDKDVVGVVGTLNSSVAQSVQPVLVVGEDHDGLAGQHQPVAHPGRRLRDRPGAHLPELLPHLHDRLDPGPVRGALPLREGRHQGGRDGQRQEDLRPGPGQRVHRRVQEARRQDRGGRDDQPRRRQVRRRHQQDQARRTRRPCTTAASSRRPVRSRSR